MGDAHTPTIADQLAEAAASGRTVTVQLDSGQIATGIISPHPRSAGYLLSPFAASWHAFPVEDDQVITLIWES